MDKDFEFKSGTIYLDHVITTDVVRIKGYAAFNVKVDGKLEVVATGYNFDGDLITTWGDNEIEKLFPIPPACPKEVWDAMNSWKRVLDMKDRGVYELQFLVDKNAGPS